MKVILAQDVKNLGELGKVLTVKDGYARNFLIPNRLAMAVTAQNLKLMEEKKKTQAVQVKREKAEAVALSEKIANGSYTIPVKVIEEDRIFGSITPEMVQKVLETEGVKLDKKSIQMEEPIKKLGVYQILIKLHPEVEVSCKVWVVKE